jgi:colanic acid/amylovoran biosynthesis protein
MSIALLGVTGFRNRGVEALTHPIVDFLLTRKATKSVNIFSWSAEHDRNRINDARVTFVPTTFYRGRENSGSSTRRERLKGILQEQFKGIRLQRGEGQLVNQTLATQLKSSRLAIVTGGDVYSSEYGHDSLLYYCSLVHSAKAAGLPVVLLGHTVGRFNNREDEHVWRKCAAETNLLTTRDQLTYDYLDQIGALAPHTEVCADVAFGLAPAKQAPSHGFPDPSQACIALSISKGLHRWCALSAEEHRSAWLNLLRHFLDDWKVNILIIPHVQESYGDDRQLATDIHRSLGFDPRVVVAAEDLTASEYKTLVGRCQLVIAERMHAAIAGLSSQVPTVMVAYSLKVEGISALAYAHLASGPDGMVLEANSLQNSEAVLEQLTSIWHNRLKVSESLAKSIPDIKELAEKNFEHLGTLMDRLGI